jgi:hypothetical protein
MNWFTSLGPPLLFWVMLGLVVAGMGASCVAPPGSACA